MRPWTPWDSSGFVSPYRCVTEGPGFTLHGSVGFAVPHAPTDLLLQAGLCLVGCLQLVAFTSLLFQFPYLYGRHGFQPISTIMEGVPQADAAPQLNPGGAGPVL